MNAITNILARLPKVKTSVDFDAAIGDLEMARAEAAAAVAELEGQREDLIFDGGDLAALEADISAAESRTKTLAVALSGARKRREAAIEAERQAELDADADKARKLNAKLKAKLIAFGKAAEELAGHAKTITGLRAEILTANNVVREGGRGDLVQDDPFNALAAVAGRHVIDPVKGLVIPEYWPHRAAPPALALLKAKK